MTTNYWQLGGDGPLPGAPPYVSPLDMDEIVRGPDHVIDLYPIPNSELEPDPDNPANVSYPRIQANRDRLMDLPWRLP